jgi:glycosyltransferase involved in cell wall biosynthesis
MKILLGVPEFPPYHIGGGGQVYKDLAENYLKLGHEVLVIYGYYPSTSFWGNIKTYYKSEVKFYQIPEIPYLKKFPYLKIRMPINIPSYIKLYSILKSEKPDVAHLHGYGFIFIDTLAFMLKMLGIKYILTIHGWPIKQATSHPLIKILFNSYTKYITNLTLNNAYKITCVSQFLMNNLPLKYRSKTCLIFNGFDFKKYKLLKGNSVDIRKKHQINRNTKIILSLGRIAYIKGFQEMIKLLPQFIKKDFKVIYLIAGDDEGYKNDLKILITNLKLAGYVKFIGFLNEQAKVSYLKQCDFLAIPSLIEGFGLVALEGVAFDKVILIGKSLAVQEVLAPYPKSISIYDKNLLTKLGQKTSTNKKFIFSEFEQEEIALKYLNTFK